MFYLKKFGNVARLLVGMTFFISGFAKGVDIARTSFKIQEYTMVCMLCDLTRKCVMSLRYF